MLAYRQTCYRVSRYKTTMLGADAPLALSHCVTIAHTLARRTAHRSACEPFEFMGIL